MEELNDEMLENVCGGATWVYAKNDGSDTYEVFSYDECTKESTRGHRDSVEMTFEQFEFFKKLRSNDTFICATHSVPDPDPEFMFKR